MKTYHITEAQLDELHSFLGTWENEVENLRRADEIVAQVKSQPVSQGISAAAIPRIIPNDPA